jgi:glycosyltransferase involved in cell wall biosynthesis
MSGVAVVTISGSRIVRSLKAVVKMVKLRSDVTVVHDPELLVGALPLAFLRGKRSVVFDLHENLPAQLGSRVRTPRVVQRMLASSAAAALRLVERFMTVTLAEASYANLFRQSHEVFENLPVAGSLPVRSATASGTVYVGDVTRERGVAQLVEAMGSMEDRTLTIIGRCSPEFARELDAIAAAADVDLTVAGFLPYSLAWRLASDSLIGVSPLLDRPNYRNSLPTKIYEYRSVGLVVVASNLPGTLAAISGSEAASTYEAGSVEGLASALVEAEGDAARAAAAIGESSAVRNDVNWDAGRFAAFYASLVASDQ